MKDGKMLAVKLKPYYGKPVDFWCLIGGTVDHGEPVLEALEREILEETAIKPDIGKLLAVSQFRIDDYDRIELFFEIKNPEAYTHIDLTKTSHGVDEIEEIKFIDPSDEAYNLLPLFLRDFDERKWGEEVQFFSYYSQN